MPISASTVNGLKVTLGGTLEIFEALQKEDNFKFLMTAHLNQDALERFFGIVRGKLVGNDHADPETLLRLARLLSSYPLIKSPRNSHVNGTELLEVLMQSKHSLTEARKPRTEWLQKLDRLLEEGNVKDAPIESYEHDHNYKLSFSMKVQAYLAGFVVRKMLKQVKCQDCVQTLQSNSCEPDESRNTMINLMEQYGGKFGIKIDILYIVVERLAEGKDFPMVGCVEHRQETTRKIVDISISSCMVTFWQSRSTRITTRRKQKRRGSERMRSFERLTIVSVGKPGAGWKQKAHQQKCRLTVPRRSFNPALFKLQWVHIY